MQNISCRKTGAYIYSCCSTIQLIDEELWMEYLVICRSSIYSLAISNLFDNRFFFYFFTPQFHAVPSLSISTNLLVNQYSGQSVLGGERAPQVTCTPSDTMAPVQWTTRMGVVPQDYQITFSPRGLSHTATFASAYIPTPPNRTETLFCDLINVDQPNTPVNPQNVTVRFIQSKQCLLIFPLPQAGNFHL